MIVPYIVLCTGNIREPHVTLYHSLIMGIPLQRVSLITGTYCTEEAIFRPRTVRYIGSSDYRNLGYPVPAPYCKLTSPVPISKNIEN